jgi:hypothetical protein
VYKVGGLVKVSSLSVYRWLMFADIFSLYNFRWAASGVRFLFRKDSIGPSESCSHSYFMPFALPVKAPQ